MQALQSHDVDTLTAFDYGMCGIAPRSHPEQGNQMMAALHACNEQEQTEMARIVEDGLRLFETLWGFTSKTFVAPTYVWSERTEKVLSEGKVSLIQAARFSKATFGQPSKYYYTGQENRFGQVYTIRNCIFEPANASGDEADKTLSQIEKEFHRNKLAIVCTHRINYVGGLSEYNRTKNLRLLNNLLRGILNRWPDVEFMSSDRLVNLFN